MVGEPNTVNSVVDSVMTNTSALYLVSHSRYQSLQVSLTESWVMDTHSSMTTHLISYKNGMNGTTICLQTIRPSQD